MLPAIILALRFISIVGPGVAGASAVDCSMEGPAGYCAPSFRWENLTNGAVCFGHDYDSSCFYRFDGNGKATFSLGWDGDPSEYPRAGDRDVISAGCCYRVEGAGGGAWENLGSACDYGLWTTTGRVSLGATPVEPSTWGAIKAQYQAR